jgi:hypothetical protein
MNDPTGTIGQAVSNTYPHTGRAYWLARAYQRLEAVLSKPVSGGNGGNPAPREATRSDLIASRSVRICNRDAKLIPKYRRIHEILNAGRNNG